MTPGNKPEKPAGEHRAVDPRLKLSGVGHRPRQKSQRIVALLTLAIFVLFLLLRRGRLW